MGFIIFYGFETCEQTVSSFFQNLDHKIYKNTWTCRGNEYFLCVWLKYSSVSNLCGRFCSGTWRIQTLQPVQYALRTRSRHRKLKILIKWKCFTNNYLSMVFIHVFVQLVLFPKSGLTMLTVICVSVGKMNVFDVFSQITLLTEIFPTYITSVSLQSVHAESRNILGELGHHP